MLHRLRWTAEAALAPVTENANGTTTLADGVTYYAEIPTGDALLASIDYYWTSLVATITLEQTNHPEVSVSVATGTTSKWSTNAATTISPAGDLQGRTILTAPDAARYRAKCVVGGTAGNGGAIEAYAAIKTGSEDR